MIQKELINKNTFKVAVQMDDPYKLDKHTDSTLALIEEAINRKYEVFVYTVENLSLENNKPRALGHYVLKVDIKKEKYLDLSKNYARNLDDFDIILVRQDPPFDMKYITATHILQKISSSTTIINDPSSIRNCPEKLFVTDFYDLMPPTLITLDPEKIDNFIKKYKKIILKPLFGNGGKDVFYLSLKDLNVKVIVEKLLENNVHIIVQKFIPQVIKGDKRILLINGDPVGAVNRIPNKNEIRANLHIGAKSKKVVISKSDLNICKKLRPFLREKGLYFAGIDIIDGFLTEINVTSPTCIREIDKYNKINIASIFWDGLEKT